MAAATKKKTSTFVYHEIDDRDECNLVMCIAAIKVGFLAGIVLQMSPIYLPSMLTDTFMFKGTLLYKCLFSLVACGLLFNGLFSICNRGITRMWTGTGVVTGMAGALCLGCGMALCRSDPLLLFVQLATFTKSSMFTVVGCLIAAASWGFIYDFIPKEKMRLKPQYFDGVCKGKVQFAFISIPMALSFALGCIGLEEMKGYKEEGPTLFKASLLFSPYFVGCALALLQLPLVIYFCKSLQGFASWIAAVAFPLHQSTRCCKAKLPGFIRYTGSLSSSWSLLMGIGVFFGALCAGVCGFKNAYYVEEGSDMLTSMLGGFLMVIGSIYAGADAFSMCGGMANLHIPSYINFSMMMLGAFGTTCLLK